MNLDTMVVDSGDDLHAACRDLVRAAAEACGAAHAFLAPLDAFRDWFESPSAAPPEVLPFISQSVSADDAVVVEDAARFFAGVPLRTAGGLRVGTLCVTDTVPLSLSPEALGDLRRLAAHVASRLEARQTVRSFTESGASARTVLQSAAVPIITTAMDGVITGFNAAAEQLSGFTADDVVGRKTPLVFHDAVELATDAADLSAILGREIAPDIEVFTAAWDAGRTAPAEWTWVRKDGRRLPVLLSVSPLRDANGVRRGWVGVVLDISERRELSERLRTVTLALTRQHRMLADLRAVQDAFISHPNTWKAFNDVLTVLLEYTDSEYGFIGEVLRDDEGRPYLKSHAMTNIAWNDETRRLYDQHEVPGRGLEFRNLQTLFGAVMTTEEVVIANRPDTDPRRGGLPPGHPPLRAFLGAPIKVGGELVGMVGVANRASGYDAGVVSDIDPLLATYGTLIMARRNLNERHRVEVALRESEGRHRLLFEGSQDAMLTLRPPHWTIASVNPAMLRLFGPLDPSTVLTRWLLDLLPPDATGGRTAETLWTSLSEALERGSAFFEWEFTRQAGDRFPATVLLTRLEHRGEPFLLATIRDISVQKAAELALRDQNVRLEQEVALRTIEVAERERFLRAVGDALSTQIVVLDGDGRILATNAAWRRFAEGAGAAGGAQIEGADYLAICDRAAATGAADAVTAARLLRSVISGAREWAQFEYACPTPDGDLWFLCRITRFPGAGPVRVVVAHEDITSVRQSRSVVEESQRLFQQLFQDAPDATIVVDQAGLIGLVNQMVTRVFGYESGDLIGQSLDTLLPDTEWCRRILAEAGAAAMTLPPRGDARVRHRDGTEVPVDISVSTLGLTSGRVLISLRDLRERLAREARERHAQRLESLGTMAGGIAHDLNNTLTPILMAVDLWRIDQPGREIPYLDMIEQSAHRGAEMVGQLLTFAKGADGQRTLVRIEPQIEALAKVVRGSCDRSIGLDIRLADDLPPVLGDATQIHQVLLNLCLNARDAMPGGGTLTIDVSSVRIDTPPASAVDLGGDTFTPGPYLRIAVADTGSGVPPEHMDRLFEPFFTTKGPERGTGLGLPTVKGIVASHKGLMGVQSTVGHGSTFEVFLPVAHEEQGDVARGAVPARPGHGACVLVVDDESFIRESLVGMLARLGFRAVAAADGAEALRQFAACRDEVALVITDINMPVMDGLALSLAIRSAAPDVPIVVMTGLQDEERLQQLRSLGRVHELAKPFRLPSLAATLREALPAASDRDA